MVGLRTVVILVLILVKIGTCWVVCWVMKMIMMIWIGRRWRWWHFVFVVLTDWLMTLLTIAIWIVWRVITIIICTTVHGTEVVFLRIVGGDAAILKGFRGRRCGCSVTFVKVVEEERAIGFFGGVDFCGVVPWIKKNYKKKIEDFFIRKF